MSGAGNKRGSTKRSSLLATADMDRLGINPIEMLKKVFDEAMNSYYSSTPTAMNDPRSSHLAVAARVASDLAHYKHPKLSAVAFKDLTDDADSSKPATTQEAIAILKQDPFAVKTADVVAQIKSTIQTPKLPEGEK